MLPKQLIIPSKPFSLRTWRMVYLLVAVLTAIRIMLNQHGWVNNDSLIYFEQARLFAAYEWHSAFTIFPWPFYAGLIAFIHVISGLEIHTSAQCLNTLCFVLFVAGFQQLLLVSGAKLRTMHWGMGLLFSTNYLIGDVLGMLLRDEGFWAAFIWGLAYWCKYRENKQVKYSLFFQGCMLLATLFRIEAVAYFTAIPLLILFEHGLKTRQKLRQWLTSNLIILTGLIGLFYLFIFGDLQPHQLGRLQEVFSQLSGLFTYKLEAINAKADTLGQQVLGRYLDDYARISLWSTFILIILLKTAKVAGYPALLLLIWPKRQWWISISPELQRLAPFVLIVGFIVSIVIILNTFVLSSRYVIASGIVMLSLATFAISYLERYWERWIKYAIISVLTLMLLNNLRDHNSIDLARMTVTAVGNLQLSKPKVFYDTENARFYAHQPFMNRVNGYTRLRRIEQAGQIDKFDVYVITSNQNIPAYEKYALQLLTKHHFIVKNTLYGWHKKSKAYILIKKDLFEELPNSTP